MFHVEIKQIKVHYINHQPIQNDHKTTNIFTKQRRLHKLRQLLRMFNLCPLNALTMRYSGGEIEEAQKRNSSSWNK